MDLTDFSTYMPQQLLELPANEILNIIENHFGQLSFYCLDAKHTQASPCLRYADSGWIKTANTVGINVRTLGSFWKVVPYVLTLPEAQNSIHLLPIWEPGVVSSLYAPASWNINPAFFSAEMAAVLPELDTVEKQLKVVVNLLHLMGKAVGMDVVPHTDRFSEMVLAQPHYFEWLQRKEQQIVRHDDALTEWAAERIFELLQMAGPASDGMQLPISAEVFFNEWSESDRLLALFGHQHDYQGRLQRRKYWVQYLYELGLETVPATMGPPYRGIEIDPSPDARTVDEEGRVWYDYRITKPEKFSRVFGPLTRYRLYGAKNDNRNWEIDFDQPIVPTWEYVARHYAEIQSEFGFDFMRGDMSHVQMRPDGVPENPGPWYDIQAYVKTAIQQSTPHFAYFAESFLAPPGEMAYGNECDHLEASLADSTLGDLQSEPISTIKFMQQFAQYRHWLESRRFAPNFTLMTADKDDPRFDAFYLKGNELRYFIGLFLTDMPSYMGLGFECRDPHPQAADNEYYTKLYVFYMPDGPKGTNGPWKWGNNTALYNALVRQKQLASRIFNQIEGAAIKWLLPPDESGQGKTIAWTQVDQPLYCFFANLDTEQPAPLNISLLPDTQRWRLAFSTHRSSFMDISDINPGEGLVFELEI